MLCVSRHFVVRFVRKLGLFEPSIFPKTHKVLLPPPVCPRGLSPKYALKGVSVVVGT